jgi:hypothetical protein
VSEEENKKPPPDLPDHDAEYTTVEEAAEAAAKSAEIASKAAKAAAAMARHGGLSREQSNASSKSYSSRDSPRKHDMEEVSSKPDTFSISSMQTSSPLHARGPKVGPSKSTPDSSPVTSPSPPSQSSAASDGYCELYEVTPSSGSHKSQEFSNESSFSTQKRPVQKEEEYGYSGISTKYNNSNDQGVAIWDDIGHEEEPENVSCNLRFDSFENAFDDSRHGSYDRPAYKEESFYGFERKDSSSSEAVTAWFSSDNFSSPQLPKSGSAHKDSSSFLFTSGTSEWDPPRSPADKGSSTKFDKGPKSASSDFLFNDNSSDLLSVLSGQNPTQSCTKEDSIPKFDSGPNFDSDMLSDDVNDRVNSVHVHVSVHEEEEKVVDEEYLTGSSLSPLSHAKERTKTTFTSSSNESRSKKYPQSLRTRDSRKNHNETVQHEITKEHRAKADDDDDLGRQEFLNYDKLIAGRRNRAGSIQPPYKVKPLAEEPKPSIAPAVRKPVVDLSVEEEWLYSPNRSNSREFEVGRNRPFEEEPKPSIAPAVRKPVVDLSVEEERLYSPNRSNSREFEVGRSRPLEEEPIPSIARAVRKPVVDLSVEEERLYSPNRSNSREFEVGRDRPFRDATLRNKPSEMKDASRRSALHYTPHRKNFEDEGEEETDEKTTQPAKIKLKVPSSSRVPDYSALDVDEGTEEEVVKPDKLKLKEVSSSRVSRGYLGVSKNQLDYQEPLKVNRRVVGSGGRDSLDVRNNESPMEKTTKAAPRPSKSNESWGPLRYVPAREDSDEEEQARTAQPKESTKSSSIDESKEKVDLKEKKEEKARAQPTFPLASFPLDMDALRARVQHIKATMNNP